VKFREATCQRGGQWHNIAKARAHPCLGSVGLDGMRRRDPAPARRDRALYWQMMRMNPAQIPLTNTSPIR